MGNVYINVTETVFKITEMDLRMRFWARGFVIGMSVGQSD